MHDESSNQPGQSGHAAEPGNPARRNFMKNSALAGDRKSTRLNSSH